MLSPSSTPARLARGLLPLLLVLVGAGCVPVPEGRNVFSGSLTVADGETIDEDVNLFDGDLVVAPEGRIDGDVRVFSGSIQIDGRVDGDVLAFSGDVRVNGTVDGDVLAFSGDVVLGPEAQVTGDIGLMSGQPELRDGARVGGDIGIEGMDFGRAMSFARPSLASRLLGFLVSALLMALVAAVVYSMAPDAVARASATAEIAPVVAGGAGLLVTMLALPILILLAITICGIPIALALGLLLLVAGLFGHTALGQIVGLWLEPRLNRELSPLASTSLGAGALSLATSLVGLIPCLGWLIQVLVGSLALGVTLLTLFGRRDYPSGPGHVPPVPPAPPGGSSGGIDWAAEAGGASAPPEPAPAPADEAAPEAAEPMPVDPDLPGAAGAGTTDGGPSDETAADPPSDAGSADPEPEAPTGNGEDGPDEQP